MIISDCAVCEFREYIMHGKIHYCSKHKKEIGNDKEMMFNKAMCEKGI